VIVVRAGESGGGRKGGMCEKDQLCVLSAAAAAHPSILRRTYLVALKSEGARRVQGGEACEGMGLGALRALGGAHLPHALVHGLGVGVPRTGLDDGLFCF